MERENLFSANVASTVLEAGRRAQMTLNINNNNSRQARVAKHHFEREINEFS